MVLKYSENPLRKSLQWRTLKPTWSANENYYFDYLQQINYRLNLSSGKKNQIVDFYNSLNFAVTTFFI